MSTEQEKPIPTQEAQVVVPPTGGAMDKLFSSIPADKGTPEEKEEEIIEEPKKEPEKEEKKVEEDEEDKLPPPPKEEDEDESIIDMLSDDFGEVEFEEGQEFDDELSAVKEYIKKRDAKLKPEIQNEAIEMLFEKYPLVQQLAEHLHAGMSIETFMGKQLPEFKEIDLYKASESQMEAIIRSSYKAREMDDEEIEDAIELAKDTGKLKDRAEKAQKHLKGINDKKLEARQKKEQEEAVKIAKQNQEYQEQIESTIEAGKLGNITLDNTKKTKFKEFLYGQNKEGKSIRQQAWQDLSPDKLLLVEYLVSTDFEDLKFEDKAKKAKTTRNITIKSKSKAPKAPIQSQGSGLSLDKLFN